MTVSTSPRERIVIRETDSNQVDFIATELGVSPIIAKILVARKLLTFDECKRFFRPDATHFHDPFLFEHMEKAVSRILQAIENNEKIIIYGDYDVDGITATVLLMRVLKRLGATCDYFLPNRLTQGYGMSIDCINEVHERKATLIISVDCGITAVKEVAHASTLGIDTIITDHHETQGKLPEAVAILDPKIEGCAYPYKKLAGVGVAMKLCQALAKTTGSDDSLWQDYLDIVSVGTAADIVPLTGENRVIVKLGFTQLSKTDNIGLQKLINLKKRQGKELSTADVVFLIAPCINAAGRLGDQDRSVKLLLTDDGAEASLFAKELVEINRERQALDKHVQEQAANWVCENVDLSKEYAIVAGDPDWHVGVIGISASKMVEKFYRPTFLFSIDKDGMARGSARSVRGLHLLDAITECSDLLESFGGHSAAAGGSIKIENLPAFRSRLNDAVKSRIEMDDLVPHIFSDAEVTVGDLTPKFFNIVKQMEPFGPGNMRPVLYCKNLINKYPPRVVGKNHLKMTVSTEGQVIDAIAFNYGDRLQDVRQSNSFSMAFSLDKNEWNGRVNLQMKVKGIET